ncbi:MAG: CBS domain-containing protein, partial [Planctomycetota bacterium]
PAMLVCIIAFMLSRKFTLYEKQLPSRLDAPSKVGYMARAILRRMTVAGVLETRDPRDLVTVRQDDPFQKLVHLHWAQDAHAYPVVDAEGKLVGVVEDDDIRHMIPEHDVDPLLVAGDMMHPATTVHADQSVLTVVNLFATEHAEEVVVTDPKDQDRPIATLTRADVLEAYSLQVARTTEETI